MAKPLTARERDGKVEITDHTGRAYLTQPVKGHVNPTSDWKYINDLCMDWLTGVLADADHAGDSPLSQSARLSVFNRTFHDQLELACRRACDKA